MNAIDIAKALDVNERTIRRAIATGRLPAVKRGRAWDADLEEARKVISAPRVRMLVYQEALADALSLLRAFDHEHDAREIEERYGLRYVEPKPGVFIA